MTEKQHSKTSIAEQIKKSVSDATDAAGSAMSKTLESAKSTVSDALTSETIMDIGKKASETAESLIGDAAEKFESAKNVVVEKASIENLKRVGDAAADMASIENVRSVGKAMSDAATLENTKDAVKYASGIKGYKEIIKAKEIKRQAEEKIRVAMEKTEEKKEELNRRVEKYTEIKIAAINNTICSFIEYLKRIGQKNKGKEYEALKSIDVKKEDIADMEDLGISTINLAKGTAGSSLIGAIALFGTKAAVLQGVVAFASASTGTAISGLSGAAATNATLAFLGGGSIASGGGGAAAGASVLGGITAGAFLAETASINK